MVLLIFLTSSIVLWIMLQMIFAVVTINGESMTPALQPNDRVLVLKYWPKNLLKKTTLS